MAVNGKRAPGMLDMLAGRWLRAWRMSAGVSREEFAERAGITVQQIQKYEDRSNRISASRLAQFAEIVERAPGNFFIGAEILQSAFTTIDDTAPVDADTCDLLIEYFRSGSEVARARIVEIVRSAIRSRLEDHGSTVFVLRRPTEFRKAA